MLVKKAPDIRSSEITDKKLYLRRREFIQAAALTAVGAATGALREDRAEAQSWPRVKIPGDYQRQRLRQRREADSVSGRHDLQQLL